MPLKAIRQVYQCRVHMQNTGIAVSEENVIICYDADITLIPFTIGEIVLRHPSFREQVFLYLFRFKHRLLLKIRRRRVFTSSEHLMPRLFCVTHSRYEGRGTNLSFQKGLL